MTPPPPETPHQSPPPFLRSLAAPEGRTAVSRFLLPGLVLLLGFAVTFWVSFALYREGRDRNEERFDREIAAAQASITVRMNDYINALRGGASFLAASIEVDRREWRIYSDSLQLDQRYPGLNGIGVILVVAPGDEVQWLERVRAEGVELDAIRPFPATVERPGAPKYVITYCEPTARNRVSIGRDISTEESRRVAAELARDTGEPRINLRIRGSRDSQRRSGFLLYVPLYRVGSAPTTVAERQAAHYGWVYAQFFADSFLSGVLGPLGDSLQLHLFEQGDIDHESLLYRSTAGKEAALPHFERVNNLELAGQKFQLGWRRGTNFPSPPRAPVLLTAVGFGFATVLLAGLVATQQNSRLRAIALVRERTQELEQARNELVAIFSAVGDGILQQDESGNVVECNAAAARILGFSRDQLVGRPLFDASWSAIKEDGSPFAVEDRPLVRVFRTGQGQPGVTMGVHRADGALIWLHLQAEPQFGDDGKIRRVVSSVSDITERRRVARALEEQEARLRLVVDELPVGIRWVRQIDGKRDIVLNPAHERITGVTRAESEQPNIYLTRTHPDDVAAQEAGMQRLQRGEISHFAMEKRYVMTDGRVKWVNVSWTRRLLPGERNFEELSTVVDFTARKEAELALRGSLHEVNELKRALDTHGLVAVTDLKGRILQVNARLCAVSKYSAEELIGHNPRMLNSGLHPRGYFQHMWHTIARGEVWRGEIRNRAKDGSYYWVSSAIVPSLDEKGRPLRYVAIQIDITAQKQLEENLAQARDQALELSRMKSEFMATVSHEIRTPMNAVLGMAELLADTPMTTDQSEMLQTVCGGAESLLTIINDILDFSRIEAGRLRLDLVDFDLRQTIEDVISLLAPQAQAKQVELICDFSPEAGCQVLGDSGRIRQVATNLIGNAIKFTERGEVAVTVSAQPEEGAAARLRLRLTVRDTGIGIPDAARARLFQPFVQADGSTTRRFGGTGLGLAIARQLVELMGGRIGFDSEVGQGSVFWFEVDFVRRPSSSIPAPAALPAGRRVLVIDDNETNRGVLCRQLAHLGVESHAVEGGAAALACLCDPQGEPWHAVLLDHRLLDQNGLEVAAAIHAEPRWAALPIILLSSTGEVLPAEAKTTAGLTAMLSKPVFEEPLARCLAGLLAPTTTTPETVPALAPPRPDGLRVLIAEDNHANQRVASLLLQKLGHETQIAVNGADAIAKLAAREFDVVLMDCQMPVLDGYEATRQIRAGTRPGINPRIPIIALTAHARPDDRAKCLAAGMDDYVSKPLRGRDLQAALQRRGFAPASSRAVAADSGPSREVFDVEALATTRDLPGLQGKSLLAELVAAYLADEPQRRREIARLAAERKAAELSELAHAFGGEAAAFGGANVRQVALELESAADAEDWTEVVTRLRELETACDGLRAEIDRLGLAAG